MDKADSQIACFWSFFFSTILSLLEMSTRRRYQVLVYLAMMCAVVLNVVWVTRRERKEEHVKETVTILKNHTVRVEHVQLTFKNLPLSVTALTAWKISISVSPCTVRPEIVIIIDGESRSSSIVRSQEGQFYYHVMVSEPGDHRIVATLEFLDVTGISKVDEKSRKYESSRFQHYNSTVILNHNFSVIPAAVPSGFDCSPQTLLNGSWLPASKFPNFAKSANHAGLPWLWKPYACLNPVFQTAQDFRHGLTSFRQILFVGDSLMRNIYNAVADLAVDYELPFHGMKSHWCRSNQSKYTKHGNWELQLLGKYKRWFGKSWCGEMGGANLNVTLDNANVQLTYRTSAFSADTPGDPILSVLANYTFDCLVINYGLHDESSYSLDEFEGHISRRMAKLADIQRDRGVRVIFLGMWAQRPLRKPAAWKWSGSHTRVLDFIQITKLKAAIFNVEYLDIYSMTLALLDFNEDGIHFLPEVNRPIAMILSEIIGAEIRTN